MFSSKKDNALLAMIRTGQTMTGRQKLSLIVQLSIPSILAQLSSTLMFYIDASMVGSLGAQASAAIGLVESTTWLFGGLTSAAAMGFSVQAAHFIGANDFVKARQVFRQGLMATAVFTAILTSICLLIARPLPIWLGGGEDIVGEASLYFAVYAVSLPVYQIGMLASSMLKCSGNMRVPSIMSGTWRGGSCPRHGIGISHNRNNTDMVCGVQVARIVAETREVGVRTNVGLPAQCGEDKSADGCAIRHDERCTNR